MHGASGGPTILQFFPRIWTNTPWLKHHMMAGQEQKIQFLGAQHPHSAWMMVRIILKSIVDITSWTGKNKRTTSNLLSSHDCQHQYRQHGKHRTTCLIVRENHLLVSDGIMMMSNHDWSPPRRSCLQLCVLLQHH